ncbi:MAG: hypothetical protein WBA89_29375 [Microcoleus sp.]|uniref:hypothetical protein n=1 Tax=Microcoleus sp. TaxID=44472 RepID=UPI003C712356
MKIHNLLNSIAATVLVTGLALTGISSSAVGEQIRNNDRIDGVIRRTSPIYRFRNMWTPGAPTEELRGQEYTFSAREGDNIEVFLDTDRSRGFTPVMVLFYGNNKQVAFTQDRSFNYQIPRTGDYTLLVLAKDAARGGSYTLEVAGIDGGRRASSDWRDDRRYSDRNNDRNSRSYDGERILQDDFGLRPLDCRLRRTMVRVRFEDADRDQTYCAIPTRQYPQGDYYYNPRTRDLESARVYNNNNDNNSWYDRDRCRVSVGGVCVTR